MLFNDESKSSSLSDTELIQLYAKTGEASYVGVLFQRYSQQILGVCLKYLKVEDKAVEASHDIYIVLTKKLQQHVVKNFPAWLHALACNHCLGILREEKKEFTRKLPLQEWQEFVEILELDHLLNGLANDEVIKRLENALSSLKPEQRICIEKFFFEDKSYEEIATETGFAWKAVKSHIQNGKRNLRNLLEKS